MIKPSTAYKWLPVITDYCHGCGLCVEACDHGCLDMVWDFARLHTPADCGSEGKCMEVCPAEAIHMEWAATTGDRDLGVWCDELPEPPRKKWSLRVLFGLGE